MPDGITLDVCTADEIEDRLRVERGFIGKKWGWLRRAGFPRALPLPGVRRWYTPAITAWLAGETPPAPARGVPVAANDSAPDALRELLRARARAVAEGGDDRKRGEQP